MKFDVIIGNPPYQLNDGGGGARGASASPLYHKFIEKAKELNTRYISMIVPSRWMKGGKGLDKFRKEMISDSRTVKIIDYEKTSEVFHTQGFDGGVNYFLWDRYYNGETEYKYIDKNNNVLIHNRKLKNTFSDIVIRDPRQTPIIEKISIKKEMKMNKIVSTIGPFGFGSDFLDNPNKYYVDTFDDNKNGDLVRVHGVSGQAGGCKRISKFINKENIKKNKESVDKYKLFFSKAFNLRTTVPPKIITGNPGEICTATFLKIGDFSSEEEMNNCLSYIKTKFFRALFYYRRHSLNISQSSFEFVPLQDFSKPWTDEELYKKYKLTQKEIDYIEENIAPMD